MVETKLEGVAEKRRRASGNESAAVVDALPASRRGRPERILYVQYTNPAGYPPLEHSSRIFVQRGAEVLFLGTGAAGAGGLELAAHPRIAVKRMAFQPPGWRQKVHYLRYALWVAAWTVRWRPDWVYASDAPAAPVASALSFLPGVRVLYHEHDSPAAGAGRGFTRLFLLYRRKLASRADLVVLPNEQRAERFTREVGGGDSICCVWNCPRKEEVAQRRKPLDARLVVAYHGSLSPARLPASVVEALVLLPDEVTLVVTGYETIGFPGYAATLEETARRVGVADRVRFVGALSRDELLRRCRSYDVGLALVLDPSTDVNLEHLTGASNKPFDYLACGLAVLVPDRAEWRRLFVEPGYALACEPRDPQSIAAAIRWLWEHPVEMRRMGELGRRRIVAEWNYETLFAPVIERMGERSG